GFARAPQVVVRREPAHAIASAGCVGIQESDVAQRDRLPGRKRPRRCEILLVRRRGRGWKDAPTAWVLDLEDERRVLRPVLVKWRRPVAVVDDGNGDCCLAGSEAFAR